jgi:hypothetical protein
MFEMTTDEDWYKAAEDDPEELSLLSAVMGVTREVSISLPRSSLS